VLHLCFLLGTVVAVLVWNAGTTHISQNQPYFFSHGTVFFSHNKSTLQISRSSNKSCRTKPMFSPHYIQSHWVDTVRSVMANESSKRENTVNAMWCCSWYWSKSNLSEVLLALIHGSVCICCLCCMFVNEVSRDVSTIRDNWDHTCMQATTKPAKC